MESLEDRTRHVLAVLIKLFGRFANSSSGRGRALALSLRRREKILASAGMGGDRRAHTDNETKEET